MPREALIEKACVQLVGENPDEGGHYITVWAPRQRGKTWIMREVLWKLQKDERFQVLKLNLEHLKLTEDSDIIIKISEDIIRGLKLDAEPVQLIADFVTIFEKNILNKPLILIMDEFDALVEEAISGIAGVFRNIYNLRQEDPRPAWEKEYLLHGVALIGFRSV